MRIAIIADTHGNLISLDAVLGEIDGEGIEGIVCLGDVAGLGARPGEVIARLRALACPVVMGNADEFLLDPTLLDPERHPDADETTRRLHEMERWCAAQLQPEDLDFIRTFQPTVEIPIGDGESLLCYHGSPRSNWDEIRASTPDAELAEKLGERWAHGGVGGEKIIPIRAELAEKVGERRALVMAGGHTHEQFYRRLGQTIVINPGSVGLPYETVRAGEGRNPPWAEYAVLTYGEGKLGVDLRRVPVDQAAIRRALLASGMPHAAWWAADWH